MNKESFSVVMTMFKGRNESGSYTYEITFNRSMEHTGRFRYIEEGLNAGLKKEIENEEKRQTLLSKFTPEEIKLIYGE